MDKRQTDKPLQPFDIPLIGKLRTDVDPILLAPGDFQELKNIRYRNTGIRGIRGMTATNSTPTTYTTVRNGFHFKKDQPNEDHIIVQTVSGSNSSLLKATSSTIPSVGDDVTYSAWNTLSGNNTAYFYDAPDNCMTVMDGVNNYIWGGNEYRCAKFINFNPDNSFWYDYSQQVANSEDTTANRAVLKRISSGIDSNTKALWHFNNSMADAVNSHTLTINGGAAYTTGHFSDGIFLLSSANQYLSIADHADFDMSSGIFAIDLWINCQTNSTIYYQQSSTNADSFLFDVSAAGALGVTVKKTASSTFTAASPNGVLSFNVWHHIAVSCDGVYLYMFVDGNIVYQDSPPTIIQNYTGDVQIGYDGSTYAHGILDELRISVGAARYTSSFSIALTEYTSGSKTFLYVGATRQIQGIKFYVHTGNTAACSPIVYYWNGTNWVSVGSITDTTSVGGKTLNTTGTMSFTLANCIPKVIREVIAYYYQIELVGLDDNVSVYYSTVDAPLQPIVDIWDNSPRQSASAFKYTTDYSDNTVNVSVSDYVSTAPITYMDLNGLTSSQSIYFGFMERCMGISFRFADSTYVNSTPNTSVTVYYWNGSGWALVGTTDDGTSSGGVSFRQTGIMTWRVIPEEQEFQTNIGNSLDLYYYKVVFNNTLSNVRLDYVYGITCPKNILPHRFSLTWQNRLWLFNELSRSRNSALCSSYGTVVIFNGTDSTRLYFGGSEELVAGATVFSRFGGSLYDNLVLFKRNEVYLVDGVDTQTFKVYTISDNIGCIAPNTLVKCDTSYEVAPGLTKHILIWQSAGGIQMFDGNSISKVSHDIDNMFDSASPDYVGNNCDAFYGFFDQVKLEYHWITTTREMVFDLLKKKWYEIDRGTGKHIVCGFPVMDSNGMQYIYGGTSDGFIERLEYGNTFDGNAIQYSFRIGDIPLAKTPMYESEIRHIKVIGVCKSGTVVVIHYADGETVGTSIVGISQVNAGHRIYQSNRSVVLHGVFHSFKCSISTTSETIGFEPLNISGLYKVTREDLI